MSSKFKIMISKFHSPFSLFTITHDGKKLWFFKRIWKRAWKVNKLSFKPQFCIQAQADATWKWFFTLMILLRYSLFHLLNTFTVFQINFHIFKATFVTFSLHKTSKLPKVHFNQSWILFSNHSSLKVQK